MTYIQIPKVITYKDLEEKGSLSPSSYRVVLLKNKNIIPVLNLLEEKPIRGKEVGSEAYVHRSPYFFMRTQAISDTNFTLEFNCDSFVPIKKKDFQNTYKNNPNKLVKEGDIFYVKGGNVGAIGISHKDFNAVFSSHLFKLKITKELRHYVFAILKNQFSKAQILNLPIGAIKGLDTFKLKYFENIVIPFPDQKNKEKIIELVGLLTKAIVKKEAEIKRKYNTIIELIDKELKENQAPDKFVYSFPTFKDLQKMGRIDASLYTEDFKRKFFEIANYKRGCSTIDYLGYKIERGQNLQISNIGKSIYSEEEKEGFYRLILSRNLTEFMTVAKYLYIGNPKKLKLIQKGDIIFTCRGKMGRCLIFCEDINNTITNIDNVHLINRKNDLIEKIFLGLLLGYLKRIGIIDRIAIKGAGAESFTKYQFDMLKIPSFSHSKKEEIAEHYFNPITYKEDKLNLYDFEEEDIKITKEAGILQLDEQMKLIKQSLDNIIHQIVMDQEIKISFDFLRT